MTNFVAQWGPWYLSVVGVAVVWWLRFKQPTAWLLGIFLKCCWVAFAVITQQWGFLLSAVVYGAIFFSNWRHWRNDDRCAKEAV